MEHSEKHDRENEDYVTLAKVAIDVPGNDENQSGQASTTRYRYLVLPRVV